MPPLTLTYRPVTSSRHAAGGGGGLMSGRSIFTPPHYFRLTSSIHAARRGLKHTARFNPTKDWGVPLWVIYIYCFTF